MPDRQQCRGPEGGTCRASNPATPRGGRCRTCAREHAHARENARYAAQQLRVKAAIEEARKVEPDNFGLRGAERVLRVMLMVAA